MEYINLNPTYRGRVRSGCLTCRSKRVKCTEERPVCKTCTRLKRECIYGLPSLNLRQARPGTRSRASHAEERLRVLRPLGEDAYGEGEDLLTNEPREAYQAGIETSTPMQALPVLLSPTASTTSPKTISLLTSQDIYICTTIDWLSANDSFRLLTFDYFLNEIDIPQITPFDPLEWRRMKQHICGQARDHRELAAAIGAVQLLWRAHAHGLPVSQAQSQYRVAEDMVGSLLGNTRADSEVALLTVFVLGFFCIVLFDDKQSVFTRFDGLIVRHFNLELTPSNRERLSRIAAWLCIIHSSARRGGNKGILSPELAAQVAKAADGIVVPCMLHQGGSASMLQHNFALVFQLFHRLQAVSLKITNLSHYHRSRRTAEDQDEVEAVMADLKDQLCTLWLSRPEIMDNGMEEIERGFEDASAEVKHELVIAINSTTLAYHAEMVEIGRTLSDPHFRIPESVEGMQQIRQVVDRMKLQLSPGCLRPLFLYAIESLDEADAAWAIQKIRDIPDPISRSNFFASYAEGLVAEQFARQRRVTTRWFCYRHFGTQPPFL